MNGRNDARATLTIAAIAFLYSSAAATSLPVTFESPCSCCFNNGLPSDEINGGCDGTSQRDALYPE
jgi:hypothetical protein